MSTEQRTALVLGGSGLIGQLLLERLATSDLYSAVQLLMRSEHAVTAAHFKVTVADYEAVLAAPEGFANLFTVDDVFCCLGTTIKTVAGDKQQFYRIDHDYPVEMAKLAKAQGAKRCFSVSALGAAPKSSVFYNQVKGETERDLSAVGFDALHLYQPSLLLGKRDHLGQPKRSGEGIGQALMPLLNPFLMGGLKKYRPTHAEDVAQAMIDDAARDSRGIEIHCFE